jgi:sec-independent protein translocase protein TatC
LTQEEKDKETKDPDQFRMTFTGHLEELRRRLTVCAVAVLVGMVVAYVFRDSLFAFILHPLFEARGSAMGGAPPEGDRHGPAPTGPAKAAELARDATRLSKRALEAEDPREAARLAAKSAERTAKAVEILESAEEQRAVDERRRSQRSIAYTNPVKPFWVSLQLSLVVGICLAFGVILWEIWAFVAPGLYSKEKRYAAPFIISATGCFVGGAAFGYRFVFPMAFGFLVRFSRQIADAQGIDMMDVTTVDAFVAIALKMLLAFGLIFELPVVISFLALAGIVDHKQLWRFGRWFIVIAVVLGAMLTPPDVISQVMMAVPMALLYLVSIGLAYVLHPSRRKKREEKKKQKADKKKKRKASREDLAG